jgi:hypothetical protein
MNKFDQLRRWQEQRLVPVLESWNEAKAHLEKAIALAETREREFREVSEDVQRKLGALDIVMGMANEIGDEIPIERLLSAAESKPGLMLLEKAIGGARTTEMPETSVQVRIAAPQSQGFGGLLRRSSRPLFPARERSKYASLSILQ